MMQLNNFLANNSNANTLNNRRNLKRKDNVERQISKANSFIVIILETLPKLTVQAKKHERLLCGQTI